MAKTKLILTYIAILFFFGCASGQEKSYLEPIALSSKNFDSIAQKGLGREYISNGNIIYSGEFDEQYQQMALSIFHDSHQWEYFQPKEIIGQPLEEWTRRCKVCNFHETFITRK